MKDWCRSLWAVGRLGVVLQRALELRGKSDLSSFGDLPSVRLVSMGST